MTIFSLASFRELMIKCDRECEQLKQCATHPEYDFILMNIVFGINHLFDWYLKDTEIEETRIQECLKLFSPYGSIDEVSKEFRRLYKLLPEFPEVDSNQEIIRKLCNKAKHFKKVGIERQGKNYTSTFGASLMQFGGERAVFGGFNHYLYFVEIGNTDVNLAELVSSQLNKWKEFTGCSV
ncbi:hypothetical protein E2650_19745 [Shewanella xiamenensis]|uniref:RiboL-PSP-HEPN domain-containing protein n=1 Tax=Shewanella xiamenensis TaxID=332186 RepID=A0AAW6R2C8_9GAMM|nr:hypothetical protein [Shewanella xiamenensis]MDG5902086.1 hypothetical protein [Shewanella xiamenensis]